MPGTHSLKHARSFYNFPDYKEGCVAHLMYHIGMRWGTQKYINGSSCYVV